MKLVTRCIVLASLCVLPLATWAQNEPGPFEVGAAWGHLTGDFGLDGLNVTMGYRFAGKVVAMAQGDFLWNTSTVGTLTLSPTTGQFSIHENFQQGLGGGRFYVFGVKKRVRPFGQILLGYSRLSQQTTTTTGIINAGASSSAFSWLFGGGGDFRLNDHWAARGTLDFERTHFINEGQSRARFTLGMVYHF